MESGLSATSNSGSGGVEKGREKKNRRRGEKKIRKKKESYLFWGMREKTCNVQTGGGGKRGSDIPAGTACFVIEKTFG